MVTVAIDARVADGQFGGVQQTMLGLAMGLASLDDRGDAYLFLVNEDHRWLRPALVGPCRPLVVHGPVKAPASPIRKALGHLVESRGRVLPASDGTAEAAGADLIHFMQQRGFRTRLPNIYQPHDLQHVYHPEWFHPLQRIYRQYAYRAMAAQASRVAVMTTAARADTARHLRVPESRVIVVPWASVMSLYGEPSVSRAELHRLGVPPRFLLYPAQSWAHKNHLGLVQALAVLRRDAGLSIPVVLTGKQTDHWQTVTDEAQRLGVADLLTPLGFVETRLLRTLYEAAEAMVFPSLYEGWGLPVVEALDVGLPVLCSDITPLREIVSGAGMRFDPREPNSIAKAVGNVWTDSGLRARLSAAAKGRGHAFSWTVTAARFRAHYRDVLGLPPLTDSDAALLADAAPV